MYEILVYELTDAEWRCNRIPRFLVKGVACIGKGKGKISVMHSCKLRLQIQYIRHRERNLCVVDSSANIEY